MKVNIPKGNVLCGRCKHFWIRDDNQHDCPYCEVDRLENCPWCNGTNKMFRPIKFGISCNHDWHHTSAVREDELPTDLDRITAENSILREALELIANCNYKNATDFQEWAKDALKRVGGGE